MRTSVIFTVGVLTGMTVSGGALPVLNDERSEDARIARLRDTQSVDRTHKSDRLKPLVGRAEKRAPGKLEQPSPSLKMLLGCEPAASTLLATPSQPARCAT